MTKIQTFCQPNWNLTKFHSTLRNDKSSTFQLINSLLHAYIVSFTFHKIAWNFTFHTRLWVLLKSSISWFSTIELFCLKCCNNHKLFTLFILRKQKLQAHIQFQCIMRNEYVSPTSTSWSFSIRISRNLVSLILT